MFQVVLSCYLGLNPGQLAIFNKRQQNEETFFMARACFPSVSQFLIWGRLFPVSALLFSRCKLCLHYTAGNFNENPSMRALAKILRVRGSEHSCNFCEQFEQRPNFASTFKLDGIIPLSVYLTFRPVARKGHGSIAHEAKPNGLLNRGP